MAVARHEIDDSDEAAREPDGAVQVTRGEGRAILDRQARKYLGMSGEEFARRYRAGQLPDPNRADVIRVAMLLPYAEP